MRHSSYSISIANLVPVLSIVSLTHAFPQVASDNEATATTSTLTRSGWTSTVTALTFFTPSSGADPTPITSQSQLVTSYVPILTICPYAPSPPPLTIVAANASRPSNTSALLYSAATASTAPAASNVSGLFRRQAGANSAPYANSTVPTSYLASCSVSYTATTTQICHTTLSPLASPVIPVTDCEQQITFSTDHGYKVVPGNRTVDVQALTSYYAAPWDDIATGVPQGGIQKEVCSTAGCRTDWEAWSTGVGWVPEMSTFEVGPPVSVTGPVIIIIHPSLPTLTIPDGIVTPISISTTFPASTSKTTTTIEKSSITSGAAVTGTAVAVDGLAAATSTSTSTHTNTFTRVLTVQGALGTGF